MPEALASPIAYIMHSLCWLLHGVPACCRIFMRLCKCFAMWLPALVVLGTCCSQFAFTCCCCAGTNDECTVIHILCIEHIRRRVHASGLFPACISPGTHACLHELGITRVSGGVTGYAGAGEDRCVAAGHGQHPVSRSCVRAGWLGWLPPRSCGIVWQDACSGSNPGACVGRTACMDGASE